MHDVRIYVSSHHVISQYCHHSKNLTQAIDPPTNGLPVPQQQFSNVLQGLICQPPRTPRTTNQNIPKPPFPA